MMQCGNVRSTCNQYFLDMKSNYERSYLDSFENSVALSEFRIKGQKVDISQFFEEITRLAKITQEKGAKIFFYGNGASFAFADHMALDWSKNGKVNALSLSSMSLATALSNDYSYEDALVEHFRIYGNKNDLIVTISSSGNSQNIKNIIDYANRKALNVVTFSGLKESNYSVINSANSAFIPAKTYGIVECAHQLFLHLWLDKFMKIEDWNKTETQNMNSQNFIL